MMLRCNWINCILFTFFYVASFPSPATTTFLPPSPLLKTEKSLCEWRKIPFTTKNAITVNLFSWQFGYLLGFIKALKKRFTRNLKRHFYWMRTIEWNLLQCTFLSYIIHFPDAAARIFEKIAEPEVEDR